MRVFTRTTKVLGVGMNELEVLADMVREAKSTGNAEQQISNTDTLRIEVSEMYVPRSHGRQDVKEHKKAE